MDGGGGGGGGESEILALGSIRGLGLVVVSRIV
jgi:hypothetical protein